MKTLCLLAFAIVLQWSCVAQAVQVYDVSFISGESSLTGTISTDDGVGPIDGSAGHRIVAWAFRQRGPDINFDISSADPASQMICDEICFSATETSLIRLNTFQNEPNQVFFIHQFSTGDECCAWAYEVGFVPLLSGEIIAANRVVVIVQGHVPNQDPDFVWNQFVYGEYAVPMEFPRLESPQPNPAPATLVNLVLALIASLSAARSVGSGNNGGTASSSPDGSTQHHRLLT